MKLILFLSTVSVSLLTLSAATATREQNWPAWRGPTSDGISTTANPPVHWSESKGVKWKVKTPGRGSSTPVIWGEQLFLLTAIPVESADSAPPPPPAAGGGGGGRRSEQPTQPQKFTVVAFDRATGKILWEKSPRTQIPHEGHHRDHGFASGSPVTDGEILVASFGSFGIYGYDLKGNLIWEKDLGDMRTRNSFGEGSSPALYGNTVVVLWDHEGEDFIVALDKRDGKELWRRQRDEPSGWSTPLIVEHGGKLQVVVNGSNRARGYDLATGEPLWEAGGQTVNAIPSPIPMRDQVIITSGFRGSALQVIRLDGRGDLTGKDSIVWSLSKNTPYVPSPLLYGDNLYFFAVNNATLSIVDAKTGKVTVDAERLNGISGVYASPVGAADRVYLVGRDGGTVVLKNAPTIEVLATNKLDDGFDASPALVGRDLFLRGRESLYCLSEAP